MCTPTCWELAIRPSLDIFLGNMSSELLINTSVTSLFIGSHPHSFQDMKRYHISWVQMLYILSASKLLHALTASTSQWRSTSCVLIKRKNVTGKEQHSLCIILSRETLVGITLFLLLLTRLLRSRFRKTACPRRILLYIRHTLGLLCLMLWSIQIVAVVIFFTN